MKIIFLDIDGVLLSGRAWALPANALAAARDAHAAGHSMGDVAMGVHFDPVAVALVNRLCAHAGARLVVHSNWRRNVGLDRTRRKLVEQGVDEEHFHQDWACGWRKSSGKGHDIRGWLDDNRLTPRPAELDYRRSRKAEREWDRANRDYGFPYVVLDDQPIDSLEHVQVAIDEADGLGMAAYRHACGYLGGVDRGMGVVTVSPGDLDTVTAAWGGDGFLAARWLHASSGHLWSPAMRLGGIGGQDGLDDALALYGYGVDRKAEQASRRAGALADLLAATECLRKAPKRLRRPSTLLPRQPAG